ncbi:protein of unknown function [Cupriavidus taiwanensis]|nr:protein of unknown function [Cupriavidus taiwanensis]
MVPCAFPTMKGITGHLPGTSARRQACRASAGPACSSFSRLFRCSRQWRAASVLLGRHARG